MSIQSLDHRSSLRKLPFPASCSEALRRLHHQCATLGRKQPSPKETEVILDVLEEFIFSSSTEGGSKSGKNSNSNLVLQNNSAIQELQMLQVLMEFFSEHGTDSSDLTVLSTMFVFLYMEPTKKCSKNRVLVMAKFISLAMGLKNSSVLTCAAIWLQQEGMVTERCREFVTYLVKEYLLLLPCDVSDEAWQDLMALPADCPLFVANFVTAVTEIYYTEDNVREAPPQPLLKLVTHWMTENPTMALTSVLNSDPDSVTSVSSSTSLQTPFLGIAKWTILGALFDHEPSSTFSELHFALLQSLSEAHVRANELKIELMSVKKVNLLIQRVELALNHEHVSQDNSLNRLAMFLQAITMAGCLSGKAVEIIGALKRLPSNKLIQMFVKNLAGVE